MLKTVSTVIIPTGGTFDKVYNPATGELEFPSSQTSSSVVSMLQTLCRSDEGYEVHTPFEFVDSRDMTDEYRHKLFEYVEDLAVSTVIVVHGTDTMVETWEKWIEWAGIDWFTSDKNIFLTGSMIPAAFPNSDAPLNFAYTLASSARLDEDPHLDPDIWISMSGRLFPSSCNVRKNYNGPMPFFEEVPYES